MPKSADIAAAGQFFYQETVGAFFAIAGGDLVEETVDAAAAAFFVLLENGLQKQDIAFFVMAQEHSDFFFAGERKGVDGLFGDIEYFGVAVGD